MCVAALQAEVQRLRHLQQQADEKMKEEELRRQIDQYKQVLPGFQHSKLQSPMNMAQG